MPTIPQAIDYGPRPSLRSGRVDPPDRSGLIMADAIENAANTFANVMVKRKGKRDALNYASVKSQLLTEDIKLRRELAEDPDYETHEERYRTGMATARDRLTPGITDHHDRAIFDADANLTVERGSAQVGENSRRLHIDRQLSNLDLMLEQGKNDILTADPATRNDLLLNILSGIDDAVARRYLTAEQGTNMRQGFVKDVATAELMMMDPEAREEILAASIGGTTGTLADFLNADVKVAMHQAAQLENKTGRDRTEAFSVVDAAVELYQLPRQEADRNRYVREHTEGDVRAVATTAMNNRNSQIAREDLAKRLGILSEQTALMQEAIDDPNTSYFFDDIPASVIAQLEANPGDIQALKDTSVFLQAGEGFADVSNAYSEEVFGDENMIVKPALSTWNHMSDAEKAAAPLELIMWKENFTRADWLRMDEEQAAIKAGTVSQIQGPENSVILRQVMVSLKYIPQTNRTLEEEQLYNKVAFEFDRQVELVRGTSEFGGGHVPWARREQILREILGQQVWMRNKYFLGRDQPAGEESQPFFFLSVEDQERGFIPMVRLIGVLAKPFYEDAGEDESLVDFYKAWSATMNQNYVPDREEMENAALATFAGDRYGFTDENVLARLAGTQGKR